MATLAIGSHFATAVANEAVTDDSHETRYFIHSEVAPARQHASDLRLLTGYDADPGDCGEYMLGPLDGRYSGKEAWLKLIAPVCKLIEEPDEQTGTTKLLADMSDCKCSFGFPRLARDQQAHVLVTGSKLPGLADSVASPVLTIDRERLDQTGAATIPDLLRYLSQTAFHRGRGDRASGAQYAELRGLGAGYTLLLLNSRRTIGSATDLTTNVFDLSYIPLDAVERLEISTDPNSLVHGMDAIGGIVNVVRKSRAESSVSVRLTGDRTGGSQRQGSLSIGKHTERGQFAVFLETAQGNELLGRERDRWRNQDFTRFGG